MFQVSSVLSLHQALRTACCLLLLQLHHLVLLHLRQLLICLSDITLSINSDRFHIDQWGELKVAASKLGNRTPHPHTKLLFVSSPATQVIFFFQHLKSLRKYGTCGFFQFFPTTNLKDASYLPNQKFPLNLFFSPHLSWSLGWLAVKLRPPGGWWPTSPMPPP